MNSHMFVTVPSARRHQAALAQPADWQTESIRVYRTRGATHPLEQTVAARIYELTGHTIGADSVVIDQDGRTARVSVDGIRWRWNGDHLVLLRPCAHCGCGEFASPRLQSPADLGFALSDWQPRHAECTVFEADEWW